MKKLNYKIILQMMGILLLFNGSFMLFAAVVSKYFRDGAFEGILFAGILTMLIGGLLQFVTKGFKKQITMQNRITEL